MAREANSTYSDWRPIPLTECVWGLPGFGTLQLPPTTAFAADQLTGQLNGGGETPKITMSGASAFYLDFGGGVGGQQYGYSLPLPDFLFDKQPGRFPAWDGLGLTPMDLDGSLMRAIQIENILIGGFGQDTPPAADLIAFGAGVKFRGFGSNADASTPTQDQTVAAFAGFSVSAFGDMVLPSPAPFTQNAAPSFVADPEAFGVLRIRTMVLIPFTCAMGDQLEMGFLLTFAVPPALPIQFYSARYRWLDGFAGPLPQAPNSSVQLFGQDAEGYQQLFGQSRLDDLPYEP